MRNISRARGEGRREGLGGGVGSFDHQSFIICPTPPTIGHWWYPTVWVSNFNNAKVLDEKALLAKLAPDLYCGSIVGAPRYAPVW